MHDSVDSDELLVQAAGRGDPGSFERLVLRHQDWAWRIAWRFTGSREDASDIVQESFLRLLNAAERYRPDAAFRTYFYRIISRLCLDRAKKKQPVTLETLPDTPDPGSEAPEAMISHQSSDRVRAALDILPSYQRMAIVLRYYDDLNYQEIASVLKTSPKAVERLLARGRERLRAILGNQDSFFKF